MSADCGQMPAPAAIPKHRHKHAAQNPHCGWGADDYLVVAVWYGIVWWYAPKPEHRMAAQNLKLTTSLPGTLKLFQELTLRQMASWHPMS